MLNVRRSDNIQHSTLNIQHSPSSPLQPTPRKPGPLQPPNNVRILPHDLPYQPRPVVLDHGDDGPLIDAEVIDIDPSLIRVNAAVLELLGGPERRVEGI